jgi:hypothetical protein
MWRIDTDGMAAADSRQQARFVCKSLRKIVRVSRAARWEDSICLRLAWDGSGKTSRNVSVRPLPRYRYSLPLHFEARHPHE